MSADRQDRLPALSSSTSSLAAILGGRKTWLIKSTPIPRHMIDAQAFWILAGALQFTPCHAAGVACFAGARRRNTDPDPGHLQAHDLIASGISKALNLQGLGLHISIRRSQHQHPRYQRHRFLCVQARCMQSGVAQGTRDTRGHFLALTLTLNQSQTNTNPAYRLRLALPFRERSWQNFPIVGAHIINLTYP